MPRWAPDSADRLFEAALALYGERGFESTTVAEIAERAGLTERTFFRHFADKREVLFRGGSALEERLVRTVEDALATLAPIDAVGAGVEALGEVLPEHPETARRRQAVINANAELQERELAKLASLSAALADALRRHGAPEATLTAELGIAVFRVAFERWIEEGNERDFPALARDSLAQLKTVTASR